MSVEGVVAAWLVGVGLLVLELVASGSGLFGILGAAALVGAVGAMAAFHGLGAALALGGASALACGVLAALVVRRHALRAAVEAAGTDDHSTLLGLSGVTTTVLRPAGFASIGGRRVDVETEGEMLPAGTTVEVVSVEGNRIVVRAAPSPKP